MKSLIPIFLFCITCFKINAQNESGKNSIIIPYTVHTPTVLPQYPAINTPIKILVLVTSGSAVNKTNISYSLNLQQNIIDISACYFCFPATVPSYVKDTVNIGLLPAGTYTVNLKTYFTNSQTVCINKTDSTSIIDTVFTISNNVGLKSDDQIDPIISIYPNPIKDKLSVEFRDVNLLSRLTITNTLGQVVYSTFSKKLKEEIDVDFLTAGIYYLKVETEKGQQVFKIIKE